MKKILFIILTIILACVGIASAAGYYGANSVAIDSNCNKSQYYPLGRLCQDKDDAKLYKGIGSAIEEIGSATVSPTTYANIIDISPADDVIPGKRYKTVAAAQTYLLTVSPAPSATNIWGIRIYGTNSENINIGRIAYVHYLGEQGTTRLTGEITSTATMTGLLLNDYAVKDCIISNLILGTGSYAEFYRCQITGGTLAASSLPLFVYSIITGGTFSYYNTGALRFPLLLWSCVYGNVTLNGGMFFESDVYGSAATLNDAEYHFYLSYVDGSITLTSSHDLVLFNCYSPLNIIVGNGGHLVTAKTHNSGTITVNGGEWTKVDSHNNDLGDLQGGTTGQYYHLTQSAYNNLTSGNIAANITGTAAGLSGTPNVSLNNLTVAGVASLTGAAITAGSGTGITVNSAGNVNRQVYKVTTTYGTYSDTDTAKGVVIATLPAKTKLLAVYADTTETYTGTSITGANLVVGVSAENSAEILAQHDVFTSSLTKGLADADMGIAMTRAASIQGGYFPSWTGSTDVYATINTTGANTDQLATGSTTFYLVTERF